MPIYLYQNDAGDFLEQFFPMGEAPTEVNGYRRVYTAQICVPEHQKADYWTDQRRASQKRHNDWIASQVALGDKAKDPITSLNTRDVPTEFARDLERKVMKNPNGTL